MLTLRLKTLAIAGRMNEREASVLWNLREKVRLMRFKHAYYYAQLVL